jgi:hypothetical protein
MYFTNVIYSPTTNYVTSLGVSYEEEGVFAFSTAEYSIKIMRFFESNSSVEDLAEIFTPISQFS